MSRPWMPLYVADYLADTSHLSGAEHGAYLLLIMHYWQKGGLPNDDRRLASIARATPEQWSDMQATIAEFFNDDWTHSRIDAELQSAREAYERRASAGRKGGKAKSERKQCSSNAKAGLKQSQPQSESPTEIESANALSSPEPEKSAPGAIVGLPTVSEGDFPVYASDIAEWERAFPAVDIRQQLAAMRQWLNANPQRRKTKRGMKRFVVSWLDRRQNSGSPPPVAQATSPPRKQTPFDAYADIAKLKGWTSDEPASLPESDNDAEQLSAPVGGPSGPVVDLRPGHDWRS